MTAASSSVDSGRVRRADWNPIAEECVLLAAVPFGVSFSFLTVVDEEHGDVGPAGERYYAEFYGSPAEVARMAYQKIDTGNERLDCRRMHGTPERVRREPDDAVSRALARLD